MLLISGLYHLRNPSHLIGLLRRQSMFAHGAIPAIGATLTVFELSIGFAILAGFSTGSTVIFRLGVAASAFLFAGFTAFLWVLRVRRPGVPCGCSPGGSPAGMPHIARALLFSLSSFWLTFFTTAEGLGHDKWFLIAVASASGYLAWVAPGMLEAGPRGSEAAL